MLLLMLVLAVPSMVIEWKLTNGRPKLRAWLGKHSLIALIFSLAVSSVLGSIFGAEGLIVFGAGIISTVAMLGVYRASPTIEANWEALSLVGKTVSFVFKAIGFILLAPFRIIQFIINQGKKTPAVVKAS